MFDSDSIDTQYMAWEIMYLLLEGWQRRNDYQNQKA